MNETAVTTVDAFTDRPFAGNPAAVCVLDAPAPEHWMQLVAREMNLSETAFLSPIAGGPRWRLRWFTPMVEVDLCGHATIAASHVLWEDGRLALDATAEFETRSGLLAARRVDDWIELDFPAKPIERPVDDPAELAVIAEALGSPIVSAGRSRFDMLVEFANEETVRKLAPDYGRIKAIPVRGVIATARSSDPSFDFVSRFFAPAVGIDEDPVCGSAHCCSGPFWAERLGRKALQARQVSPRGGVIRVRLEGDRVAIAGKAVTTVRARLQGGAGL
ncbi:PhzF family phenazine biosynthesis protein [Paludisphaera rhizosphaerae]|uniref:PhzF family phenazine biosynthesis protein n=1 Tax=Paludisphaera rhizosphaerae TaxID=2711216 RepID=UPI0013EDDA8A|nr:PhzF family phenazine biosynthesis protein [Paludisphaera rhizosphaerae]